MKFLHIADLHLDSAMSTNLGPEKAKERKRELTDTFLRIVEYADREGVRAILIAGDLFDGKHPGKKVQKEVLFAMESHPQIDFLYLRGNHDADGFLDSLTTHPENLKTFSDEWTSYAYGDVVICGAELNGGNGSKLFTSLFLDGSKMNIVMLHGQLTGYNSADVAETIPLPVLKGRNINYLALGHIHSFSDGAIDERGTYAYAGCPEGRGYDETGEKGIVELNTEAGELSYRFIPFAKRCIEEVKIDITDMESTSEVLALLEDTELPADSTMLLKITLTGGINEETEIDTKWLENRLAGRYYCLKVKDETTLHIDEGKYRYDHSLKGEFVRKVLASDLSEETRRRVILTGLKALRGEKDL